MLIPGEITIGFYKIPTLFLAGVLGVLYWVFVVWYEGRKDGFSSDSILDLTFSSVTISTVSFYLYSLLYRNIKLYHPNSIVLSLDYELTVSLLCFLSSLIPVLYFSKRWKWSKYRVLDIYSMAFSLFIFLFYVARTLVLGDVNSLALSGLIFVFYLEILRFRGYRFSSGTIFSLFCFFLAFSGILVLKRDGYLLIYGILVIIGTVSIILRRNISVYKRNLPSEFIERIKGKLIKKDRSLKKSQQLLINEDPYLQTDRATGNSESMDEAILEDYQKNVNDANKNIVKGLRIQVRKALASIKIGKYGICERCGAPIDKARLKAYPEATTCIECAPDSDNSNE